MEDGWCCQFSDESAIHLKFIAAFLKETVLFQSQAFSSTRNPNLPIS
jgi:hypothetical protein